MRQFRIDDSEKDRILNLHESATKRQYLKEQTTMEEIVTNKAIQCFLNRVQSNIIKIDGMLGENTIEAIGNYVGNKATGDLENDLREMFNKKEENGDDDQRKWDECKEEYNPSLGDTIQNTFKYIKDLIVGEE